MDTAQEILDGADPASVLQVTTEATLDSDTSRRVIFGRDFTEAVNEFFERNNITNPEVNDMEFVGDTIHFILNGQSNEQVDGQELDDFLADLPFNVEWMKDAQLESNEPLESGDVLTIRVVAK